MRKAAIAYALLAILFAAVSCAVLLMGSDGEALLAFTAAYLVLLSAGLMAGFVWRVRHRLLCTYQTVAYLAFFLFAFLGACFIGLELYLAVADGGSYSVSLFLMLLNSLSLLYAVVSAPLMALICLFLVVSNVFLLAHEGFRPRNMLGIAAGVLVAVGYAAISVCEVMLWSAQSPVGIGVCAGISYFIVYLGMVFLAIMVCGFLASRNRPAFDKDFVIVLGCGMRKDGSPTPLLARRTERAWRFVQDQLAATEKQALIVCSGGQGPDEAVSEAQCMATYLGKLGAPSDIVLLEDRSTSTRENMAFSKRVVDEAFSATLQAEGAVADGACDEAPAGASGVALGHGAACGHDAVASPCVVQASGRAPRVAFSTTNYHVFRSGHFALEAGLDAEGMGVETRWYFWPNAFLREFAGFLVCARGSVVTALVGILAFSHAVALAFSTIL